MGHLASKNQARWQARAARDVPAMPGTGESAVVMNLLGMLTESEQSSANSIISGTIPNNAIMTYKNEINLCVVFSFNYRRFLSSC